MIASSFYANDNPNRYPRAIRTALRWLQTHDVAAMEPGVYEIEGRDIFAQVFDVTTAPQADKKPEVHRLYIDVQYLASGEELLGFAPDRGGAAPAESHPDSDLYFYEQAPGEMLLRAAPGSYTIFFPSDIHRPGVMAGAPMTVRKAVVKVKASLTDTAE